MATLSTRMDDKTKNAFEKFCDSVGLTVSAAVNLFAKKLCARTKFRLKSANQTLFGAKRIRLF